MIMSGVRLLSPAYFFEVYIMKLDDVIIKENLRIMDRVKKISKGNQVENSLLDKNKDKPYDVVLTYCTHCNSRININVYHSLGKHDQYQIKGIPKKISKYLGNRKIECNHCNKSFSLEMVDDDYLMKLDCSNMTLGMEHWYDDAIPKYSNETYSL